MQSLLKLDPVLVKPTLLALALGATTLALIVRAAAVRRRPAHTSPQGLWPRRAVAMATLEAVYRRGDITYDDYAALSRRLSSP
jgi:hypothetical protein